MLAPRLTLVDAPAAARPALPRPKPITRNRPPVATVLDRSASRARGRGPRLAFLALIAAAHAALIVAFLQAMPAQQAPKAPARIEVALIAPPEPPPPPPPPPKPPVRVVPTTKTPVPAAPMPQLQSGAPLERFEVSIPSLPVPVPYALPPVAPTIHTAQRPEAPAAPAASVEAHAEPVSPPRFNAAYLDNPAPYYPSQARRLGEEGRVLLRVLVSAAGHAQRVEVARSSGSPRLDDAAVEAVRRWRFVPAKRGSEAIAASVHVPIVFSLRG
jgi:protein TonB